MTLYAKAKNVLFAFTASYVLVNVVMVILLLLGPDYLMDPGDYHFHAAPLQLYTSDCIIAPVWEELLWRFCTIEIIRRLIPEATFKQITFPLCLLLGIKFGLWHGHVENVFVQGVCGFFFSWVYIKNGFSYISSVTAHGLWNLACILGIHFIH